MNRQITWIGPGAIERLWSSSLPTRPRVLLVTGRRSYHDSGAAERIAPHLERLDVRRFYGFQPNSQLADLERGLAVCREHHPQWILAVGGGSVLDMGKLLSALSPLDVAPAALIGAAVWPVHTTPPLVAIPTTAGSGAEATHFAVVYVDEVKHSLAHPSLLPALAIVDPDLTRNLSPRLTAMTGLDALSQAIESFWAVGATRRSQAIARVAIRYLFPNLERAVHAPNPDVRFAMARGAHLAGRAINISKTTGAHALSYTLTTRYGIPHGHAVALSLGHFMRHHAAPGAAPPNDPRGAAHSAAALAQLARLLGVGGPAGLADCWLRLVAALGLETALSTFGIRDPDAVDAVLAGINAERLANNPWRLDAHQLRDIVTRLVEPQ
jgi:alcohol dehydrogenase class IV